MAVDTSASIIPLHQPKARKAPLTAAERAKNYRERKKAKAEAPAISLPKPPARPAKDHLRSRSPDLLLRLQMQPLGRDERRPLA